MGDSDCEKRLMKLSLPAKPELIPAVRGFAREMLILNGLDQSMGDRLELVVEEGFMEVVENGFEPGEQGQLDIILLRRPYRLVIAIEARGLPFNLARPEKDIDAGLGLRLMRGFADEVLYLNLGRDGQRIEICFDLKTPDAGELFPQDAPVAAPVPAAPADEKIEILIMSRDQADMLSRCVYRSFGYSYVSEYIYYPERIREMIDAGLLKSCVALNPAGEIVGHLGLSFVEAGARVGETCTAAVDPRYRGRSLFKEMKLKLVDYARSTGLYGLYSESVTIHQFTQKGNVAIGAKETGFLLGYVPEQLEFHKLERDRQPDRQTVALFYLKTCDEPERAIYPPDKYADIVTEIVDGLGLSRRVQSRPRPCGPSGRNARINIRVRPEWGQAYLSILDYGDDDFNVVQAALADLKLKRIDCVYLDLPLSDPFTADRTAHFEELGFFFGGILPEYSRAGDALRLQYLNNVAFDPDHAMVYSEFGKRLFSFVLDRAGSASP